MVTAADVTLRLLRAISKIKYMYRIVVLVLHDVNNTFFLRGAVGLCVLVCLGLGGGGGNRKSCGVGTKKYFLLLFCRAVFLPSCYEQRFKDSRITKKKNSSRLLDIKPKLPDKVYYFIFWQLQTVILRQRSVTSSFNVTTAT